MRRIHVSHLSAHPTEPPVMLRPNRQAELDRDRLAHCLRYYAFSHRYVRGDSDSGAQARIALADVMGWER